MTYANPAERTALIDGFRALADFLESNPGAPTPSYADVYTFRQMATAVTCAPRLTPLRTRSAPSHMRPPTASTTPQTRSFSPVQYRAIAICKHAHPDIGRR